MEMSESTSAPSHFAKTSHSEVKGWKMANFREKNHSRFWSWSLSPVVGPPSNTQYERTHIDCRQMLSGQKNKLKCVEQGCVWSPLLPYCSRANWLDVNSLLWQTTTPTSIEGAILNADFFSEAVSQRMALRQSCIIRGRFTDANYRAALFHKTSSLLTRYGFAC